MAGLLSLVRERRKPSTSSAVMLARSRLPNWNAKRERTNSQVLTVFFFRVGPVVLQMKIDCLGNCHCAPPVVGVVGRKRYKASIQPGGSSRQEEGGRILMDKRCHGGPPETAGRRIITTTRVTTVSGTTKPNITPEYACNASCSCAARIR